MRTHTGVATRMFGALAERGISLKLINTSEVRINVAIDLEQGREGRECLAQAFLQPLTLRHAGAGLPGPCRPSFDIREPVR